MAGVLPPLLDLSMVRVEEEREMRVNISSSCGDFLTLTWMGQVGSKNISNSN